MRVAHQAILLATMFVALGSLTPASAYVGPGLGVGAVTGVLGILMALGLMIFGAVWYPLKRLYKAIVGGTQQKVSPVDVTAFHE